MGDGEAAAGTSPIGVMGTESRFVVLTVAALVVLGGDASIVDIQVDRTVDVRMVVVVELLPMVVLVGDAVMVEVMVDMTVDMATVGMVEFPPPAAKASLLATQ